MDLKILENRFHAKSENGLRGSLILCVPRESLHETLLFLKETDSFLFNMLIDLTAVDYIQEAPRFELVYQLYSLTHNHRLEVRTRLSAEDPVADSVVDLWKTANWYEREVFDFFGIRFAGHPDLRRILLAESFEGHPLRKDYPMERRQKIPVTIEKP
ncbi:MAG: NADH-quinone oxidoreductase subunit C [bacterium]|nr:NADH-quinone oxidoreductase subunit C [bacterium]